MRAAAFLVSMFVLPLALPAQAKDSDDLSSWSLEKLCEKTDKSRRAEAVFAELERREVFTATDLARVRWGDVGVGMDEAAVQCMWGAPDSESQVDGATSKTYRSQYHGEWSTIDVLFVAGRVTDIRNRQMPGFPTYPWATFSDMLDAHFPTGPVR